MSISIHELDTVVLARDVPEANLRAGDLGAVVHVHDETMIEVEFVTASGRTQSVQALSTNDVRPVRDDDLLSVRSAHAVSDAA
jgi:hypothetical protein